MKKALDKFSKQSKTYKKFRPTYPIELFEYIYSFCSAKGVSWDCGTGNGQVAIILSKYFNRVFATDISKNQIQKATHKENIFYSVERVEKTSFPNHSFDLITVAQAIHWFDFKSFNNKVKHFPGHGNTATDSHSGIPKVSRSLEEIELIALLPFKTAIAAGVDIIMTAHIIYDALDKKNPATLSSKILSGYLREKLGFTGVIITDSFNMQAIQKNYDPSEAAILSILAGADMIMLAEERYGEDVGNYIKSQTKMLNEVEQAVIDGRIPMTRIDEAYNRLVKLKEKYMM